MSFAFRAIYNCCWNMFIRRTIYWIVIPCAKLQKIFGITIKMANNFGVWEGDVGLRRFDGVREKVWIWFDLVWEGVGWQKPKKPPCCCSSLLRRSCCCFVCLRMYASFHSQSPNPPTAFWAKNNNKDDKPLKTIFRHSHLKMIFLL